MQMLFMMLLGTALCYAGMAGLSLAMPRHYAQLNVSNKLSDGHTRLLRMVSMATLILSLWPVIAMWGVLVGIIVWIGLLSVAVIIWVSLLAYWPRFATAKALVLALIGIFACVFLWLS